jgi:hypothetical protein
VDSGSDAPTAGRHRVDMLGLSTGATAVAPELDEFWYEPVPAKRPPRWVRVFRSRAEWDEGERDRSQVSDDDAIAPPPDGLGSWRWPGVAAIVATGVAVAVLAVVVASGGPLRWRGGAGAAVSPTPSPSPSASPFAPTTYEAESGQNTLTGSATVVMLPGASGGRLVQDIGAWGSAKGDGALRFNNVVVPTTGTYVLTFFFANLNNEPTRTVVITASGPDSIVLTVAGNSTCCASQLVRITLVKGQNSITFSNPAGHAPAIDKIQIDLR